VRKALIEREILLRSAPHIMHPLRFVMPHDVGQRPAWLIRAGLFLYDRLARRKFLPASSAIDLRSHPTTLETQLHPRFRVFRRLGRRRPPGGAQRRRRAAWSMRPGPGPRAFYRTPARLGRRAHCA
jgi:hypothetical protein